ncbi:7030_t:CDS:2 [Entrophospora sp. SA101]|nr:10285_t:CDS:2 [Entrophospora sp. SA101]CAJ0632596.1 1377_t:CDS:2 [Entrophospora sp. SA101]CAJ0768049.1 7030_t:CDS:2 [Entrophospora sp. SA101]CAJ0831163.1 12932_t:CDS:2 [Entrophospora sp. SA101]
MLEAENMAFHENEAITNDRINKNLITDASNNIHPQRDNNAKWELPVGPMNKKTGLSPVANTGY